MDTPMAPPLPPQSHPQRKRKERSKSPQAGPSNAKRPAKMPHMSQDPARKLKKPHDWHLRKGDIPEHFERTKVHRLQCLVTSLPSLQVALELHIHILWGLIKQSSIPDAVTNIERTNYDARFDSAKTVKADVTMALNNHAANINKA